MGRRGRGEALRAIALFTLLAQTHACTSLCPLNPTILNSEGGSLYHCHTANLKIINNSIPFIDATFIECRLGGYCTDLSHQLQICLAQRGEAHRGQSQDTVQINFLLRTKCTVDIRFDKGRCGGEGRRLPLQCQLKAL